LMNHAVNTWPSNGLPRGDDGPPVAGGSRVGRRGRSGSRPRCVTRRTHARFTYFIVHFRVDRRSVCRGIDDSCWTVCNGTAVVGGVSDNPVRAGIALALARPEAPPTLGDNHQREPLKAHFCDRHHIASAAAKLASSCRFDVPPTQAPLTRGFLCAREWPTETVRGPQRPDCVAGHTRLELRNVGANYPFERSHRFAGIQPNATTETIRV
jgi:hypothetical protein